MNPAGSDRVKTACITVLGSGYGPLAPGTWGSFAAVLIFGAIWWVASALAAPRWVVDVVITGAGVMLASWLSVRWGEWAVERFGSADPKEFVLDEFAGQWVALLWLPLASAGLWEFGWVIGGQFVLFRVLDVIKPPPARQIERWPAGWGILCDDLVCGFYAAVIGQLIWRLSPLAVWLGFQATP